MAGAWAWDARSHRHPGELEVAFIDVGEGDCTFAVFPDGTTMLVDAGGTPDGRYDPGRSVVAPYLYARRLTRLDVMALTHAHADHMNGMVSLPERFRPRRFITTTAVLADPAAKPLVDAMRASGAQIETADATSAPLVFGGASAEFLNPRPGNADSGNDGSLVMKLAHGGARFLLTGDIQDAGEQSVLSTGKDVAADVLKAGHQGSKTSSHGWVLDTVKPDYAVIMEGVHNPFGFPHPEVLERMAMRHIMVLRTDRHGTVTFVTGAGPLTPSCYLNGCR